MSKIEWDKTGERLYETGVQKGVLYTKTNAEWKGVPWNGLISVTESPSGAETTSLYADDIKYLNLVSAEEFGGTIEAYTYPDEFKPCLGEIDAALGMVIGQQARQTFGFCYRTAVGNDEAGTNYGYKLHIVYNALASVSERAYSTINDSPEAITFSWEFSTTPEPVTVGSEKKFTALVTVDSKKAGAEKMQALEAMLYGSDDADATLPTPDEIIAILSA